MVAFIMKFYCLQMFGELRKLRVPFIVIPKAYNINESRQVTELPRLFTGAIC